MNLLKVLGVLLRNCFLYLFNSLVKILLLKVSADYLCESFIDLHHLSRPEVLKLDVLQRQDMFVVNNCGSSHSCYILK